MRRSSQQHQMIRRWLNLYDQVFNDYNHPWDQASLRSALWTSITSNQIRFSHFLRNLICEPRGLGSLAAACLCISFMDALRRANLILSLIILTLRATDLGISVNGLNPILILKSDRNRLIFVRQPIHRH